MSIYRIRFNSFDEMINWMEEKMYQTDDYVFGKVYIKAKSYSKFHENLYLDKIERMYENNLSYVSNIPTYKLPRIYMPIHIVMNFK